MLIFGPVPSRRLGRSLGINNVVPKTCTYSCVYCQVVRTPAFRSVRREFYDPGQIVRAVQGAVEKASSIGERVDYLTFVSDGEPTLDANLGVELRALRPLGLPLAVVSNSSLVWRKDVRRDLREADWVSLKVDALQEKIWRRLNRPHRSLSLGAITEGMQRFAASYPGILASETMLVDGLNTGEEELRLVASFLTDLRPAVAYISVPTRPPAEEWVRTPDVGTVARACEIFAERLPVVESLADYEGNAFAAVGDPAQGLLAITAVHPMREDAVRDYLVRAGADWALVEDLLTNGRLTERHYGGHRFFVRRFNREQAQ
ncbi:MAG: radical SAM protein [Anaerolineae bacterium]